MSLYFRMQNKFIVVTGATYPHRARLKELGASFVPDRRVWRLPYSEAVAKDIELLCGTAGGGTLETSGHVEEKLQTKVPTQVSEKAGLSISELYQKVDTVLRRSFSQSFWLLGEIESVAYRSTGVYLTLAEKDLRGQSLSVSAVVWKNSLKDLAAKHTEETIKELFHEGLKLCIECRLSLYKGRGSLTLTVLDVNPSYTKGLLALEREKTVKKLKTSGLYQANKQLPMKRFPFRIGLITAEGSRAYSDFCHQLKAYGSPAEIFFAPATMQGAGTFPSLRAAFSTLAKKSCDIIVLTRGGGSASDLRVFDDFNVASLVGSSKVPVIAAIGHHEDSPVCEEICFQALKTPTAAAEFIYRHFEQGASYLDELTLQMTKSLERTSDLYQKKYEFFCLKFSDSLKSSCTRSELFLNEKRHELCEKALKSASQKQLMVASLQSKLDVSFQKIIASCKERSRVMASQLGAASLHSLSSFKLRIETFSSKVLSFDPRPWLKKGWTRLYKKDGSLVSCVSSLSKQDELEASFLDGKAFLEITKLEKRKSLDDNKK